MNFTDLFDESYDRMYAYAWRHTGNQPDAEALTAAIFTSAFKAWPRFKVQERPPQAWLDTIAARRLAEFNRQSGAEAPLPVALALTQQQEPEPPRPEHRSALKAQFSERKLRPATGEPLRYTVLELAPLGRVYLAYTDQGACFVTSAAEDEAEFAEHVCGRYGSPVVRDDAGQAHWQGELERWLAGHGEDVAVDLSRVTPFERTVLEKARTIARGTVRPYQWLAREVGKPGGSQAIGNAMARNPIPLFVPCHRVVAASGVIGNYSMGGPTIKRQLLAIEGVDVDRLPALIRQY